MNLSFHSVRNVQKIKLKQGKHRSSLFVCNEWLIVTANNFTEDRTKLMTFQSFVHGIRLYLDGYPFRSESYRWRRPEQDTKIVRPFLK